eukprot:9366466-Pyramimonas_sp.AAC.1
MHNLVQLSAPLDPITLRSSTVCWLRTGSGWLATYRLRTKVPGMRRSGICFVVCVTSRPRTKAPDDTIQEANGLQAGECGSDFEKWAPSLAPDTHQLDF